jgi:hypothetical protein
MQASFAAIGDGYINFLPTALFLMRRCRWLPAAAALASGLWLAAVLFARPHLPWMIAPVVSLFLAAYVQGYSQHAPAELVSYTKHAGVENMRCHDSPTPNNRDATKPTKSGG